MSLVYSCSAIVLLWHSFIKEICNYTDAKTEGKSGDDPVTMETSEEPSGEQEVEEEKTEEQDEEQQPGIL